MIGPQEEPRLQGDVWAAEVGIRAVRLSEAGAKIQ